MPYAHRLDKPQTVRLNDFDPNADGGLTKDEGKLSAEKLGAKLDELEDLLFYAGKNGLLLVLQGMDTSGKDGLIRFLGKHMNGQSSQVAPFKVPTPEEMAHDFLWRIHQRAPGKGQVVTYNRSHYEDVLVVRVHEFVPKDVWSKRYDRINEYEKLLADSGTIVLKFFLHISKEEQEERLLAREQEVEKAWKLNVGDWKEREFWDSYQEAYGDALGKCAAQHAPWYIVPANRKWFRDLAVAEAIVEALEPYRKPWLGSLAKLGEKGKAELAAYRAQPKTR